MPRKKKEKIESGEQEEKKEDKVEEKKDNKKAKLEKLKEKARELEKKLVGTEEIKTDLKKQAEQLEEEKQETLVPIEEYLKSSIHLGTRVITPDMRKYVYKRRADGLAVFNTTLLDKCIREAGDFLAKFSPEEIIAVSKREAGWKVFELFSKVTGIRVFTKKYPPGILTNPNLDRFTETELVLICDPWIDKNAHNDSLKIKIPIMAICDTNNYTKNITKIIPGNNKSAKSLGMILYLLAKIYLTNRKIKTELPGISEWIENWESLVPPK